jgi:hypothetical protein
MPTEYFKDQLRRELGFIARSCDAFDSGVHDEAIRIAVPVRILIHETKTQTPLLTHLKATNICLLSTCLDIEKKLADPWHKGFSPIMFNGMGRFELGAANPYTPKLTGGMFQSQMPAEVWWNQPIFVLDRETWVTRKDVVLTAVDKDGGAHVDASLTPKYERLVRGGDLGSFVVESEQDVHEILIAGNHHVALRQIGHELLNSPELIALAG